MSYKFQKPSLFQALIPIIFLVIALFINVRIFGDAALDGSNQIILILSAGVASLVALKLGMKWNQIQNGIVKSISSAMASIIILLLIGSLAGTWLLSGIVPAMIYYGLQILNPTIFLFAACIVCSIVSLATGSSWTTAATVGIALIGIGKALGLHEGMIAGAVLSGAYFGDKMSPLSDTTNLAPAMAGTDLFTHIRYMAYTTVPSISIALILFLIIGFTTNSTEGIGQTEAILMAIDSKFNINGWLFLVPLMVIILIVKKMPAIPAILIGALLGGVFALIFQPDIVKEVSGWEGTSNEMTFVGIMKSLYGSISIVTGNEIVDELLSSGGMYGMLNTVWLIVSAMIFGGVMEASGLLMRIAEAVISKVKSTGSLVASTAATTIFFNGTASDQYLAIVVPGRMYADIYKKKKLAPENLSRTLEDSGTVTSVLFPWNTCGAYHSGVLGVATGSYFFYAFFNLISPIMTIAFAYFNIKIRKLTDKQEAEELEVA
ncbi:MULTISPECIES: Na+/H+ antiporter NhaC [Roseivirga]|uniref:Sodium:proton antiporter n=1 Tax=Roseivirga spongicola TaxID=333140 RepID=A0A150XB49_9BACT|nr:MULTISPECIES: Na+/H+ antiporter NhaC [Roseivirga]KYG75902.1 sodium:proton antiporter [Roseivirga spongicola]MBO6662860.1 Na+/H+ antiporter NhaC [Roseivirga sp.]MBO6909762.1 Na+/H+ antiporter NhaC [Roseivirga sp.]WPZ10527.1 Na+/H+ antiporter NhaC [Roseivirga spongicola]